MRAYTTPGVYFEWLDAAAGTIRIVRTDVAGFVGFAERGPLHTPVRIESWTQFRSTFGRHLTVAYLAYAVEGFFSNGGRMCYVVRVADPGGAQTAGLDVRLPDGRVLRLTASSPGRWANDLQATFNRGRADRVTLLLRLPSGDQEQWRDLAFDEDDERFAVRILNGAPPQAAGSPPAEPPGEAERDQPAASRLVRAWIGHAPPNATANRIDLDRAAPFGSFAGGEDGLWTVRPEHLSGYGAPPNTVWGLAALEEVPEVSMVAMPDAMPQFVAPLRRRHLPRRDCTAASRPPVPPPPDADPDPDMPPIFGRDEIRTLQRQLVAHCEKLRDRVAVLDARLEDANPLAVAEWAREFSSAYATLYYPWLRVAHPEHIEARSPLRNVPPSGHMAGVFARVEREVGVHKPPANEAIEGAKDVTTATDDVSHGFLNDHRINVIRTFAGRGIRVAGARTLSSETEWRYINVRRLLLMIERALNRGTQWLVFEPNGEQLWRDVDRVLRSFFDDLWRRGMLDGATAAEAYSVACDKQTMSDDDIERGHLIAAIGVQPPWPAEFIVARIGRTESGLQILEGQGDRSGAIGRA